LLLLGGTNGPPNNRAGFEHQRAHAGKDGLVGTPSVVQTRDVL
jgi:hypothetical protein